MTHRLSAKDFYYKLSESDRIKYFRRGGSTFQYASILAKKSYAELPFNIKKTFSQLFTVGWAPPPPPSDNAE